MSLSKFRGTASLIITARHKLLHANKSSCDYKVLMVGRPEGGSFASATVFPGGMHETADESAEWLQYLQSSGVSRNMLQQLINTSPPRPAIFKRTNEQSLQREISLRICALRETFEEVGLLLVRKNDSSYPCVFTNFDCAHWQHLVHNDASQFIKMCAELQVVPDLWSLQEWSTWLTPAMLKKRFETVFYIVGLEKIPTLHLEAQEIKASYWHTPDDFMALWKKEQISLPPPQHYELLRLSNFTALDDLQEFAKVRAKNHGMISLLPINYFCTNGLVSILPGDDSYPADPLAIEGTIQTNQSIEEFNAGVKRLHRGFWKERIPTYFFVGLSLEDGQILPKSQPLQNKI